MGSTKFEDTLFNRYVSEIKKIHPHSKDIDFPALKDSDATLLIGTDHETGLLWKKDEPVLPYNRILALNRCQSLEKKFHKNLDFANLFCKQTDEYILLGHAPKLSSKEAKA